MAQPGSSDLLTNMNLATSTFSPDHLALAFHSQIIEGIWPFGDAGNGNESTAYLNLALSDDGFESKHCEIGSQIAKFQETLADTR
ncbi:hypothetical protein MKX08_006165 [Trichoderma sp. CBMAI-0020]|nr:hypothetical protein MKX08_006165 [Trichoderma sp. CBMAI-0020]